MAVMSGTINIFHMMGLRDDNKFSYIECLGSSVETSVINILNNYQEEASNTFRNFVSAFVKMWS